MKRFRLERTKDVSGVSGTGVVAYGIMFPDRKTVLWWNTEWHTLGVYQSPEELIEIHGHDGATTINWIDGDPPGRPPTWI